MFTSSETLMITLIDSYVYNNNGDCNTSLWKHPTRERYIEYIEYIEMRENMLIKSNNGNWLIINKIQMNVCRLNEMKSEKNKYGIEIGIKK